MKVILLNNIKKLGSRFDVVDVAPGFGQNFLIPQKKALLATPENLANIEEIKAGQAEAIATERADVTQALGALDGKAVTIAVAANEQGGLYESVTTAVIENAIKEQHDIHVPEEYIILEAALKQTGTYQITCSYDDASATCEVTIVADDSE